MKPSELFEGPNSSLRKTFDEAVREEFRKYCTTDNFSAPPYEIDTIVDFFLSHTISKADLFEWVEDNEKVEAKSIDVGPINIPDIETQGYNQALQDLKKFISGE